MKKDVKDIAQERKIDSVNKGDLMGKEFSIEVSMVPHPWDNPDDPYFWCVFENGCNAGFGWSKTPEAAWGAALEYYKRLTQKPKPQNSLRGDHTSMKKPSEINLSAYSVTPFSNEKFEGILIKWDSDIGFGEYTIYRQSGTEQWYADSECMDSGEDKEFLRELLKLIADNVIIKS